MLGLAAYVAFGVYAILAAVVTVAVYLDERGPRAPLWGAALVGLSWPYWLAVAYLRPEPELDTMDDDFGDGQ